MKNNKTLIIKEKIAAKEKQIAEKTEVARKNTETIERLKKELNELYNDLKIAAFEQLSKELSKNEITFDNLMDSLEDEKVKQAIGVRVLQMKSTYSFDEAGKADTNNAAVNADETPSDNGADDRTVTAGAAAGYNRNTSAED
jgi:hypothetical protein